MDHITPLLAQYPGPLKLQMSRTQRLMLPAVATAFTVGCLASALDPANGAWRWLAGPGAIFFLVIAGVAVVMLRRNRFHLVLDAQGFVTTTGVSHQQRKWTNVSDFAVVKDGINPFKTNVGYNYAGGRSSTPRRKELPDWRDGELPDAYGLTVAECVELMSRWRERALAG